MEFIFDNFKYLSRLYESIYSCLKNNFEPKNNNEGFKKEITKSKPESFDDFLKFSVYLNGIESELKIIYDKFDQSIKNYKKLPPKQEFITFLMNINQYNSYFDINNKIKKNNIEVIPIIPTITPQEIHNTFIEEKNQKLLNLKNEFNQNKLNEPLNIIKFYKKILKKF